MSRLNKVSNRFQSLFKLLLLIYPLLVISTWLGWITIPIEAFSFTRLPVEVDLQSLRFLTRFLACMVQMIPTLIVMMGFYYLIQLFKLYSQNIIFGPQNVILIKKIGFNLIAQVIISLLITQPLLSLVLTMDAPPGGHEIAIGFGNEEISNLIIGGIVVLISWVMEEGGKLEEEKNLTI